MRWKIDFICESSLKYLKTCSVTPLLKIALDATWQGRKFLEIEAKESFCPILHPSIFKQADQGLDLQAGLAMSSKIGWWVIKSVHSYILLPFLGQLRMAVVHISVECWNNYLSPWPWLSCCKTLHDWCTNVHGHMQITTSKENGAGAVFSPFTSCNAFWDHYRWVAAHFSGRDWCIEHIAMRSVFLSPEQHLAP